MKMTNNTSSNLHIQVDGKCASGSSTTSEKEPKTMATKKENSYYMENYEATVTVHKSPPQQRKPYYDYIEIDDETNHDFEPVLSKSKFSKRKNLKVTFSDHIEVDVIEGLDDIDGEFFEETLSPLPVKQETKSSKVISLDIDVRSTKEPISPRTAQGRPQTSSNVSNKGKTSVTKSLDRSSSAQPLLPKRKQQARSSMSEIERKTRDNIIQLTAERSRRSSLQSKPPSSATTLPDLHKPSSEIGYRQFISSAKQMVEITRRYERPWVSGRYSTSGSKRSDQGSMRRTTSLPKNFKLPESLPSERFRRTNSDLGSKMTSHRQRITNS